MSKKNLILLVVLIALLGLGTYLYRINSKTDTFNTSSRDFSIENTDQIAKIFGAHKNGQQYLFEKIGGQWILDGQFPANEDYINNMMKTLKKMTVVNIVPKSGIPNVMKEIGTTGRKIEFYDKNDKLIKCFYIGEPNLKETAVNMVLEGSNIPYEVSLPYFDGNIGWRFFPLDLIDLRSRKLLFYQPENIKRVVFDYPRNRAESFELDVHKKGDYSIKPLHTTTPVKKTALRKGEVEAFLNSLNNVYASQVISEIERMKDTMVSDVAFLKMSIIDQNDIEKKIELYPFVNTTINSRLPGASGISDNFLTIVNDKDFYNCQQQVLNKFFFGYSLFFE